MEIRKLAVQLIIVVRGHILRCCFAEDGCDMYKGLLNTLVELLFCSFNILFGGAHWRRGLLPILPTLPWRN